MATYLTRRAFTILLVWVGVSLLTFFIANVVPADPVRLRLGPKATPETVAYWRHQWGLDRSLPEQYLSYMGGLLRGDLGTSIWSGRPIRQDLADYFPGTLELALAALLLAVAVGIPLGLRATRQPGGTIDRLVQALAVSGLGLPLFFVGLVFQLLFYRQWGLLPLDSRISLVLGAPPRVTGLYVLDSLLAADLARLADSLWHLVLPAVTLALPAIGAVARMTRASILENLGQDYTQTARAKGASEERVLSHHVLRNALLPVITLLGNTFNAMLAGVFVVETIFNWPGLGWYAARVILASDYGSIVSITLVIAILATLVNLWVDILYWILDPRIQLA